MPLLLIQDYIALCFHHFTLNPTSHYAHSNSKLYPIEFPSRFSFQVCTSMRLFTRCILSELMLIKWAIPSMSPMRTTWFFNGVPMRTMPSGPSGVGDPTTVSREMWASLLLVLASMSRSVNNAFSFAGIRPSSPPVTFVPAVALRRRINTQSLPLSCFRNNFGPVHLIRCRLYPSSLNVGTATCRVLNASSGASIIRATSESSCLDEIRGWLWRR